MNSEIEYCVIIPAFKKSSTISDVLISIRDTLAKLEKPFQIILVCDGEVDDTAHIAHNLNFSELSIVSYPHNRGKGYALRTGAKEALAKNLIFIDADLDIPHQGIFRLIEIFIEKEADLVIGSKSHPESQIFYPPMRRLMSYCYRKTVRILFSLQINDTQTGMKIVRASAYRKVLPNLKIDGFACDLEMIIAFKKSGYLILEGPINLAFQDNSTLRLKSTLQMLRATFVLFINSHKEQK